MPVIITYHRILPFKLERVLAVVVVLRFVRSSSSDARGGHTRSRSSSSSSSGSSSSSNTTPLQYIHVPTYAAGGGGGACFGLLGERVTRREGVSCLDNSGVACDDSGEEGTCPEASTEGVRDNPPDRGLPGALKPSGHPWMVVGLRGSEMSVFDFPLLDVVDVVDSRPSGDVVSDALLALWLL